MHDAQEQLTSLAPTSLERTALWLAAGVPLLVYLFTTGPSSYWLDSGEFTAAAIWLDVPHPPGHPLACLWGKLFTFLPFGSLAFRVSLAQAVASALALLSLASAFTRSLAYLGVQSAVVRACLPMGATWLLAASYAFWFQSVRAEVYALQAMFVCFATEQLVRLATSDVRSRAEPRASTDTHDARPFYRATLALGIGLSNHHLVAFLAIPALLLAFVELTRVQRVRPLLWGLLMGALGLVHYVYLPLRARTLPPMDLGHPTTPASIAWVVTARVYAHSFGSEAVQPMGERFLDLVVILVDNMLAPTVLVALLGLYLLLRDRASYRLAFVWIAVAGVNLCGRAWLGPIRANPDMLGYMMPGLGALLGIAVCGLGIVLRELEGLRVPRAVLYALALAPALTASVYALGAAPTHSLADFHATDTFDELRRRTLPYGSVVVAVTPSLSFRHWSGEAEEALRPDVTLVPMPFLRYPGTGDAFVQKHPELRAAVDAYMRSDVLPVRELSALAKVRPVFIEADASVALPAFPLLEPSGLLYRLRAEPGSRDELTLLALAREPLIATLDASLEGARVDGETRGQLLWLHYIDALYYAFHGLIEPARMAAARGLSLEPQAAELRALSEALARAATNEPLDIAPFVVRGHY